MAAIRLPSVLIPSLLRQIPRSSTNTSQSWSRLKACSTLIRENRFCSSVPKPQKETVTVIFIDRDGDRIVTQAEVGSSLLTVAIDNDVELEGIIKQMKQVKVTFLLRDGQKQEVNAKVGDNLLDIIIEHDVDIDGFGACEGTLACSTCHLIFKQEDYDKIPDKPTDEELDMLDLAYGLTDTSRLGCQVIVTKDMNGLEIAVPKGVADARSAPL